MSVERWIWVFIPIVGILWGMLAVYANHQEKMAMIEKGIEPEEIYPHRPRKLEDMFIGGMVAIGIGLAFLVTQLFATLSKWLVLPGFILLFTGITLILSCRIVGKPQKGK